MNMPSPQGQFGQVAAYQEHPDDVWASIEDLRKKIIDGSVKSIASRTPRRCGLDELGGQRAGAVSVATRAKATPRLSIAAWPTG